MIDFKEICTGCIQAVKKAGIFVEEQSKTAARNNIEVKGKNDFVTEVDKKTEEILVKELKKVLPEAGFITEEGTEKSIGEKYNWIIDPIDGTTNFIHGAPPYAISVGLSDETGPVVGVILEFGLKECFYAWKGGGAWKDDEPIHVSSTKTLGDSVIATGFPYSNYSRLESFMESMIWLMKNSHGIRRLGSAATDIAWVACGRYDGFYEYGLHPWDIAAGIIILKEAGGECADFSGSDDYLSGDEIICSNGSNHKEFVSVIKRIMN